VNVEPSWVAQQTRRQLALWHRRRCTVRMLPLLTVVLLLCVACGDEAATPTRTPFPTWTPTPIGGPVAGQVITDQGAPPAEAPPAQAPPAAGTPEQPAGQEVAAATPTEAQPTPTPLPTDTPAPVETPTPAATDTPTIPPPPSPTPTSAFAFDLETAEKFPAESLTGNVMRIYLYVYSLEELGLGGYSLQVIQNGVPLTVDEVSTAGAPVVTRSGPSPYTRFANMTLLFAVAQTGRWELQLLDAEGNPAGPPAAFDIAPNEEPRELYVRYRRAEET
jgi:hypothetical protein